MTRRIIATAEVQVGADVRKAEAGLDGLTSAFRKIGRDAERAAQSAEVAFFNGARSMEGGFRRVTASTEDLLDKMRQGGNVSRQLADSLEAAALRAQKLAKVNLEEGAIQALSVFRQVVGVIDNMDGGLEGAAAMARRLAAESNDVAIAAKRAEQEILGAAWAAEKMADADTQKLENSMLEAERRAHALSEAFRDVGRDIDLAMNGGLEGIQDDIRDTIRRVNDLGGEFVDVARIGERALDGITNAADAEINDVVDALRRLERQLLDVEATGSGALDELVNDAQRLQRELHELSRDADKADRSIDSISRVSRRTSGDVRGLIGVLGATGLGYAMVEAGRFGLSMTVELEKAEAMFLGLTGSVEGANEMLERMVVFARDTPYNLSQVTKSAAELLAVGDGFGVTTENIEKYLTSFGEAITMTGGSDEQFTRLVRVFGQMSSSGKVLGQDMNQLAQNLPGYDVWQALADGAHTSVEELRRLQNIGQLDEVLTGNKAVQILIDGMKEIPGAAGSMERRMDTLGGALEKFAETAQLATSEGLQPFAETAQDVLSSPVILRSVEDLANAFGSLLSDGLAAVEPELDDFAVAVEGILVALQEWAPVAGVVVDILGDFLRAITPVVSGLGEFVSTMLEGNAVAGKLAISLGALIVGGPLGIAVGVLTGVSAAVDYFTGANEEAESVARALAAAQNDVNDAMTDSQPTIYSAAQQAALDAAKQLAETYPELANLMSAYKVTIADVTSSLNGEATPAFEKMTSAMEDMAVDSIESQLKNLQSALQDNSKVVEEEAEFTSQVWQIAGAEEIAVLEEAADARQESLAGQREWAQARVDYVRQAYEDASEIENSWGELEEERVDKARSLLREHADAYQEWEDDINSITDSAAISLGGLAEETENNVRKMIDSINENSAAMYEWKNNIANSAAAIGERLGLTGEQTAEFAGTLAELGIQAAPAIASMVDDFQKGGTQLEEFFNATQTNAAVMASSLVDATQDASGAVPSLSEQIADGVISIEDVLAALPAAMEEAGIDFETAAAAIDASDELSLVGREAVNGLVLALEAGISRANAAAGRLAAAVDSGARDGLRVRSPSRKMMEIGEFAVEGLVRGIQNMSDEAYAVAVSTAKLISGGIEHHFRNAASPKDAARDFAENIAQTIIDELLAERQSVADAAESLADAAADRLDSAWDRIADRFKRNDIASAIKEAKADIVKAEQELAAARSLAGAGGRAARTQARERVVEARAALAAAQANDTTQDSAADAALLAFQRASADGAVALKRQQDDQVAAVEQRIALANRNLDPAARSQAEAELAAMKERHEAEQTQYDRDRDDQESLLKLRFDNEDKVREAAIKSQEDQLKSFEKAVQDIVDDMADAVENMSKLQANLAKAKADERDPWFDRFEQLVENIGSSSLADIRAAGSNAGLTGSEVERVIKEAQNTQRLTGAASVAAKAVDDLLASLSVGGLFTLGANGALGIAAGISSEANSIAVAMQASVQAAVTAALRALEIRSPSRVTERMIGEPMAQGIAAGLSKAVPDVGYAMSGLLDSVMSGARPPSTSGLVEAGGGSAPNQMGGFSGPLVSMPGAIIQDATDVDLVAQRTIAAFSAAGISTR